MVITNFKIDIYDYHRKSGQTGSKRKAGSHSHRPQDVCRIHRAAYQEQRAAILREAEETYLNTRQVRELLNVCEGTLNLWAKRGYLVPVKVGNKNMYAKSDIRRVQTGNKSESVTSYCKKNNG